MCLSQYLILHHTIGIKLLNTSTTMAISFIKISLLKRGRERNRNETIYSCPLQLQYPSILFLSIECASLRIPIPRPIHSAQIKRRKSHHILHNSVAPRHAFKGTKNRNRISSPVEPLRLLACAHHLFLPMQTCPHEMKMGDLR